MPPQTLYPMLLDQLIDGRALVAEARKTGLDHDPTVQRQVAAAEDRALQTAVLSKEVGPTVTDEAVKARYDQEIAGKPGEEEVHARHILVDTEAEAKKIIAQLKGGAEFGDPGETVQQGSRRRAAGRRPGFLQAGRDGAGVRRRRLRHAAGRGLAAAGAQPVRLARHQGGGAPPAPSRRASTRRATNCARR